MPTKT